MFTLPVVPKSCSSTKIPAPTPKAGEALVKVDAAGLNYIDVYFRIGQYKAELPLTLGMEAGGTVTAVGAERERGEGRRQGRLHGCGRARTREHAVVPAAGWSCCRPASAPSRAPRRCCRA